MNIERKDNYTLVTPTETSFESFIEALNLTEFENDNLLLNLLSVFDVNTDQVNSLSEVSMHKKENGTSFIVIAKGIEIDDLEDETLSVVPTLTEAEDTLEMDEIERDLGL